MANVKITELPALGATPADADILEIVDDVAGTPTSKKVTVAELRALADNSVTLAKMAHGTAGNLITYDAAGAPAAVATGTAGQVLTSAGVGAAPTMQDAAAGGGAWTYLSTVTASDSATVDIETTFSSTYDSYLLIGSDVQAVNNSVVFYCRFKLGGSYVTTGTYGFFMTNMDAASSSFASTRGTVDSQIEIANSCGNAAERSLSFALRTFNPTNTSRQKLITTECSNINPTGNLVTSFGSGTNTGTGALSGLRFYFSTGNILAGTFRLYGIANS